MRDGFEAEGALHPVRLDRAQKRDRPWIVCQNGGMPSAAPAPPYAATPEGLRLVLRLTPRASRNAVEGVTVEPDGRAVLRVRLRAPPVDGAANAALVAWLASALDIRKSDIRLAAGETSRVKRIDLAGDSVLLAARLEALIARA
jgi:hypothetical protein